MPKENRNVTGVAGRRAGNFKKTQLNSISSGSATALKCLSEEIVVV